MNRISFLFFFCFLIATGGAASASPNATAQITSIVIISTSSGVQVTYTFSRPVNELQIGEARAAPDGAVIEIEAAGFSFDGHRITASRPFRSVRLTVTPDTRDSSARYPMLTAVDGRGFVLFAPYILPESGRFRLLVREPSGSLREVERSEAVQGYLAIGFDPPQGGGVRFVGSTSLPKTLDEALQSRARALLSFFRARLGTSRDVRIVVAYRQASDRSRPSQYRGDVTPNGFALIRITGGEADGDIVLRYVQLLAHELFHLWNAPRDDLPDQEAWLHEGSADYFSWIAIAQLWPQQIDLAGRVEHALRDCATLLRGRALSELSAGDAMQVRYPCGAVINWIADAGIRGETSARSSGLAIWAQTLRATGPHRRYSTSDFMDNVRQKGPKTAALIQLLVNGHGLERWYRITRELSAMGADVRAGPPTPFAIRSAAIRPLVLSACGEIWGLGEDHDAIFALAPPTCAGFASQTFVRRIDGVELGSDPQAAYERVAVACTRRESLDLLLEDDGGSRHERIVCSVAADQPEPDLRVGRSKP